MQHLEEEYNNYFIFIALFLAIMIHVPYVNVNPRSVQTVLTNF